MNHLSGEHETEYENFLEKLWKISRIHFIAYYAIQNFRLHANL